MKELKKGLKYEELKYEVDAWIAQNERKKLEESKKPPMTTLRHRRERF